MKSISLWQPWASAIPAGLKTIETRSWSTNYRGPLAIHAAKRWTPIEFEFWRKNVIFHQNVRDAFAKIGIAQSSELPLGCIVATCEIYDCLSTNDDPPEGHNIADSEDIWGNFEPDRFGWLLKNIKALPVAIPCIGRQGFFDWSP